MGITLGCDPELFLCESISGKMISAIGKIGGSKEAPLSIDNGCAVQEDNVAAEFNIPPAKNLVEFKQSIQFVLHHLEERAKEMGLGLARNIASHSFDNDQLETWQSQVFGCDPDYNAWNNCKQNPRPYSSDENLRSCGGHIHVGTTLASDLVIKSMDLHLGIPALSLDKDTKRRELYGKAGAFRFKSYGCEYRSLSNFWIWDEQTIEWAYYGTEKAIEFVEKGKVIPEGVGLHIQKAINEGNKRSQQLCLSYLNQHL